MPNEIWLSQLQKHRAIAVIRAPKIEVGQRNGNGCSIWGNASLIEITWNSDRAGELISQQQYVNQWQRKRAGESKAR